MNLQSQNKKPGLKLVRQGIIAVVVITVIVLLFKQFDISQKVDAFLSFVPELGFWAPLAFISFYALGAVLFIPGSALTLGAGVIFGVAQGTIIVSIGSVLGATLAFLIGRYFARGLIQKKLEQNTTFKAIDDAVANEGWKIVGLTRLSPIFPFALLNYGYGITKVSLKDYCLASWIGMLPGTVMYVYLGAVTGSLASDAQRSKTPGEWALLILGLVATIAVTVYITKIAKKSISNII